MGKALVIVESPAKARTIGGMLGPDFIVESSDRPHPRPAPGGRRGARPPTRARRGRRLGVDVDNGFKPLYVVSAPKKSVVANLKQLLKDADELYLATDEDREGESIAWHLSEVLSPTVPVKRMVFHEITPAAIARAVDEWRDLDRRLVDAQEARRILDRLYGYEVSPGAVAQGHAAAVGRPGPERGHPHGGRARAGPHARSAPPPGGAWRAPSPRRAAAGPPLRGHAGRPRAATALATGRDFDEHGEQHDARARSGCSARTRRTPGRRGAGRPVLHRALGHREALPPLARARRS